MTSQPICQKNQTTPEYFFKEGCYITEWWNDGADPSLSVARARVDPGVTTRVHRLHGITERYVILEGKGEASIEGLGKRTVLPGDVLIIPPSARQSIHNPGPEPLVFLALCTPRFTVEAYEDVESTDPG